MACSASNCARKSEARHAFHFQNRLQPGREAGQARRPCVLVQPAGLLLVAAPWVVAEYWLAQLTFVLIYAVVGLGLMLLAGFHGLFSLGHAAFLGVGAYTQAVMVNAGVPFPLALVCAGLFSAIVGVIVGLPALRVKGIYLGMATLAFGFIVEEGMARWESVTGGNAGLMVSYPKWAAGRWTAPKSFTSCACWSPWGPRWPS
jgi:ABC-type branched-subunit amino acid transport system permease subunit